MKSKKPEASNIIDFSKVKKTKTNKKLKCINATVTLDEDVLDEMKNQFDFYFNKEKELFNNGSSKE